ncbi:MAG: rod shape-determining protein MreC [Candidatus Sumerlaeota bacterium]|nr:rod shape-determining protein MreC [Candidatus Sumerlaeota bacterium]
MPTLARTRHRPRRLAVAAGALVALSAAMLFVQSRVTPAPAVRQAGVSVSLPLVEAGAGIRERSANVWTGLFEADQLRAENERLRESIATLRLQKAAAETLAAERAQAGELAAALPAFAPHSRPAPVIAPLLDGRERLLWIGLGQADGIAEGQAVLGPEGLLGAVRDVYDHHALVLLSTDPQSRWGGEVRERGELGIVHGTGSTDSLEFRLERTAATLEPGDVVQTSGTRGSLIPAGIPLGVVDKVSVTGAGERRARLIVPEVAGDLRTVFVLDARQIEWEPPQ